MTFWTQERVDQATSLWKEGKSAAQVAKAIKAPSRNAVIAKLHRLGLTRGDRARAVTSSLTRTYAAPNSTAQRRATPPAIRNPASETPQPADRRRLREVEVAAEPVQLAELGRCACRYPVSGFGTTLGETSELLFCGAATPAGKSYCESHAALTRRQAA